MVLDLLADFSIIAHDIDATSNSSSDGANGIGGSASSLQVIKDKSNFYTDLPDAIVWAHISISTEAARQIRINIAFKIF